MLFYTERAEEIIAHFIGQFEITLEQSRQRLEYAEFAYRAREHTDAEAPPTLPANALQMHKVGYYQPGVEHAPEFWHPRGDAVLWMPRLPLPEKDPLPTQEPEDVLDSRSPNPWRGDDGGGQQVAFLPGPGQHILVVNQQITLEDNDILNLGSGPAPTLDPGLDERLHGMVVKAQTVAAELTEIAMPAGTDAIPEFVEAASGAIGDLVQNGDNVVASGEAISGTYVNGVAVDAAPKLEDLLPSPFKTDEPGDQASVVHDARSITEAPEGTLSLQAGSNLLNNSAVVAGAGLLGGVVAAGGELHRIDAIVQVAAVSDHDAMQAADAAQSAVYNIATFSSSLSTATAPVPVDGAVMPVNWQLSMIEGDAVFLNWICQVTFAYDNDLHVLTTSGAHSNILTGVNFDQNIVSFADLGTYYDLILIGGSVYDVNMIFQTNVLLDDDVSATGGAESGGGNLLYNSASIANIGPQAWSQDLPEHYADAMDGIGAGRLNMPGGFAHDAAFAGLEMISVLYIAGNVYDLNYIKQMNVLGDADQVTLAEVALLDPATTSDWQIDTGSNALINTAAILDVDVMGTAAYVDGEQYSDAVLIQAEILTPAADGADPEALASEVIAFLHTEDSVPMPDEDGSASLVDTGAPLDAMQTMLA